MSAWKGTVGKGFTADAFSDYVATLAFPAWRPQFVVLHNTAVPTLADWHSVPGDVRMKNLESYYQNGQQWSAGPHLFVADDLIWVFTPLNVSGVHSPSWNSITWGVEIIGDYAVEPFGPAVRENTLSALATLHAALGLNPDTLRLHKEDPRTTHMCPGKNVIKAEIVQGVHDRLAVGEHVPGGLPTTQGGRAREPLRPRKQEKKPGDCPVGTGAATFYINLWRRLPAVMVITPLVVALVPALMAAFVATLMAAMLTPFFAIPVTAITGVYQLSAIRSGR